MLKYKFKLRKNLNNVQEILCDVLYMSLDLTFISGITSPIYGLINGQNIFIKESDSDNYKEYPINIHNSIRRGYVIYYEQKYPVITFNYNKKEFKGIIFADGNKYIANEDGKLSITSSFLPDNEIVIDNINDLETVIIDTKYYAYDGIITIGNMNYEVDYDDDIPSITLINNVKLDLKNYDKKDIKNVVKFIIFKKQNYLVTVDTVSFTKPYSYIISGNTYNLKDYNTNIKTNIINKKLYLTTKYTSTNDKKYYLNDYTNNIEIPLTIDNYNPNISIDTLKYKDTEYYIYTAWQNTNSGNHIHLYLNDSDYSFFEGQKIIVTQRDATFSEYNVMLDKDGNKYVSINGQKYYAEKSELKYLVYYGTEYEIFNKKYQVKNSDGEIGESELNYVLIDNIPLLIKYSNADHSKATRVIDTDEMNQSVGNVEYEVKTYQYIIIKDTKYLITNQVTVKTSLDDNGQPITYSNMYEVINYTDVNKITLTVSNVTSSNQLRCAVEGDDVNTSNVLSPIVTSPKSYIFELENSLFDNSLISNTPSYLKSYKDNSYTIYKSIDNINLHINLLTNNGINLHQDYVCENDFINVNKELAINRIIDMERDIYSPAYYDSKTKIFYDINTIKFNLHLRTRNLNDWSINNNYDINSDCNWNILDYYNTNNDSTTNKPNLDLSKYKFYQPADLLYFLNFTNDDVFYQKDKVGKSFLRLSYYDSPDPRVQSLLHTATIFMNEGELYKKYINNQNNNGLFISVNSVGDGSDIFKSENIGVNLEPILSNETLTMDETKRLSASFTVKDMFNSTESSEGFYLYLFREYSNGLYERDIYLKVEFNHAGVGRTITFTQPYRIDDDENYKMLNLSDENDMNILKSGCKLQDMYNNIFIKIHVKYDFNNKKFYYYLPDWLTENNKIDETDTVNTSEMIFNLYELKLSDESNLKK